MKYFGAAVFVQLLFLSQLVIAQNSASVIMDIEKDSVTDGAGLNIGRPFSYIEDLGSNEKLFSFSITAQNAVDFSIKIILPEDAKIIDKNGLLVSRPVSISTDGRRIFLEWSKALSEGEEYTIFVQYKTNGSSSSDLFPLVIAAILIIGLVIGYSWKRFEKEKAISQMLSEDEKKVVERIRKTGEMLQEDIKESTGWSKTKISKIVRSLEMKNVIIKVPYKKTNKIKIK